jgi:hypothetical protein
MDRTKLLIIACLCGFVGDATLQMFRSTGGPTGWGLDNYFKQHGPAESLFIAGGMMTLFYALFMMTPLKINYINLAIYGVLLDLLFRKLRIFNSLDGYYTYLNYFWSGFWQAFSMCLPLFIYNLNLI